MVDRENVNSNYDPGKIIFRCKCESFAKETKEMDFHLTDRI